jgi:hypothetical protein
MPVLNFKPQFVPFILDGTKRHTIRATRKRPIKSGDYLGLYTGLRQKGAKLLMATSCYFVEAIDIFTVTDDGDYLICLNDKPLNHAEAARLAWCDGFRPPGSTKNAPGNSIGLMMQFWRGRLPFSGQIIHWWYTPNDK